MKQLIINTEFFLQCHGSCSGCFLTELERNSNNIYNKEIFPNLELLSVQYKGINIEHLVIGFGRGNILNLEKEDFELLLDLMSWCENNFNYSKLTFEVSTSLIGKLEKQIEKALFLLSNNRNIYFNIVVNSEITSLQFWKNLSQFYDATAQFRQNEFGWIEDWGDIIVLNVNPTKLPNLEFIEEFTKNYQSPINISIFPFDKLNSQMVSKENLINIKNWSEQLWKTLHKKDLNIKNYLKNLGMVNIDNNINDLINYQKNTEKSYYFIDKNGIATNGSLSIMGEVDKLRLLDKYDLEINILDGYKSMQKNRTCATCEYQKECLLSGAYLNLLANEKNTNDKTTCLSGYQQLFELANN